MPFTNVAGWSPETKKKTPRKKAPSTKAENPHDPRNPAPHGTVQRYRRHKCRCEKCKTANREAQRVRRTGDVDVVIGSRKHGTRSCYVGGCRKPECVKANRAYQNAYMRMYRARGKSAQA